MNLGSRDKAAFSLVEVVIAMGILALLTLSIISSITFSSRATRLNSNRSTAKNIAQGILEDMMADNFWSVGGPNEIDSTGVAGAYVTIPTPAPGATPPYANPTPVWIDQALGIATRVTYKFSGFGVAESGSTTTLVDNYRVNAAGTQISGTAPNWQPGEWVGSQIYIVAGTGSGQFSTITANTANTLTFSPALLIACDSTSVYMINGGKTVTITTEWSYLGNNYIQTLEGMVVNTRGTSGNFRYGFDRK